MPLNSSKINSHFTGGSCNGKGTYFAKSDNFLHFNCAKIKIGDVLGLLLFCERVEKACAVGLPIISIITMRANSCTNRAEQKKKTLL